MEYPDDLPFQELKKMHNKLTRLFEKTTDSVSEAINMLAESMNIDKKTSHGKFCEGFQCKKKKNCVPRWSLGFSQKSKIKVAMKFALICY